MAGGNQIVVVVGATVGDVVAKLGQGATAVRDFARQTRAAGDQARTAGNAVGGLERSFKSFAQEQRGQARMLGFYVAELGNFVGASQGAKAALGQLSGGLLDMVTGSLFGAVVGGLGAIALAWRHAGEAGRKAAEENKKRTVELTELLTKQREELEKIRFLDGGGTERTYGVEQKRRENQARLDELNRRIAGMEKFDGKALGQSDYFINLGLAHLGKVYEERARIVVDLQKAEEQAEALDRAEADKRRAEEEKRRQEEEKRRRQEHYSAILKQQREYQEAFRRAEDSFSLSAWQASKGVTGEAGASIAGQGGVLGLQDRTQNGRVERLNSSDYAQRLYGYRGMGQESSAGISAKSVEQLNEKLREQREEWGRLGHEVSGGFARSAMQSLRSVATGARSVGEAIRDMMQGVGTAVLDVLQGIGEKWIQKTLENLLIEKAATSTTNVAEVASEAAVAAAATMASISAIPVVGPAMAPAAAAEAYAATMAYAPLAAAEGGWRLPETGGPFPMLGHRGERMLNEKQNRDYDDTQALLRRVAAGGGGGPTIDLRGARFYGKSSYEEIVKESGRGVQRAHRNLARRGIR